MKYNPTESVGKMRKRKNGRKRKWRPGFEIKEKYKPSH